MKDKTISDHRSKLNTNNTKIMAGGNITLMKSNLMKADYLMNFRIDEGTDIHELKRMLMQLISETQTLYETLHLRSNKLREVVDLYQSNVQFDDMLFLKEKDLNRMNQHIKHLTDTLVSTSKNELVLNEKLREITRLRHELSSTKNKYDFLNK